MSEELLSPKYLMNLVKKTAKAIHDEYTNLHEAEIYLKKWQTFIVTEYSNMPNFYIHRNTLQFIDLESTLHSIEDQQLLIQIAMDVGVDVPGYIPCVPQFKVDLKSLNQSAYNTFEKAMKMAQSEPDTAVGLANSTLESIIKKILKENPSFVEYKDGDTLYKLTQKLVSFLNSNDESHHGEIKTIIRGLLGVNQSIEKLRSEKTNFHGKTHDSDVISNSLYTYFIINSVSTIGLFIEANYEQFKKAKC